MVYEPYTYFTTPITTKGYRYLLKACFLHKKKIQCYPILSRDNNLKINYFEIRTKIAHGRQYTRVLLYCLVTNIGWRNFWLKNQYNNYFLTHIIFVRYYTIFKMFLEIQHKDQILCDLPTLVDSHYRPPINIIYLIT